MQRVLHWPIFTLTARKRVCTRNSKTAMWGGVPTVSHEFLGLPENRPPRMASQRGYSSSVRNLALFVVVASVVFICQT